MAKPLQQLIDERFGTPTGPSGRAATVTVTATETVVLPFDPNRLSFLLVNLGTQAIYVTETGVPSTSNGIRLEANGGFLAMEYQEDAYLVGREWRGASVVGSQTIRRVEVDSI